MIVRRRSYRAEDRMPNDHMQKFEKKMVCQTLVASVRKVSRYRIGQKIVHQKNGTRPFAYVRIQGIFQKVALRFQMFRPFIVSDSPSVSPLLSIRLSRKYENVVA